MISTSVREDYRATTAPVLPAAVGGAEAAAIRAPIRVLHVDYSVGFGGAIKSLGLTLGSIPRIDSIVLTSQDPPIVERWLSRSRVMFFRRLINYRAKQRVAERARPGVVKWVATKAVALADIGTSAFEFLRIWRLIVRERIEIVHLNNGFTPPEALGAARAAGVPCVVHLRDFHRDDTRVASAAARGTAAVITVSDAVARSLDDTAVAHLPRTTIHDPVDLEAIRRSAHSRDEIRRAHALADDDVAVGIFGRVVRWKGQLEFVRALVAAMRTNHRVKAIIVGDASDGPPGYLVDVRAAVEASELSERVVFTGYQADVEGYYAAMDIVVHASTMPEPFGMVVPEAMASGCAVIAADAGGPREVITSGVDGILVEPGDVDALARAVSTLAADGAMRRRLGEAARLTAQTRMGIATSGRQIAAVYDAVLAGSRR
jgi:glycosyltransferase involved in cell wall biosynthesis